MENEIKVFESVGLGFNVRALEIDGDPWFILADVCKCLEIVNGPQLADRLNSNGIAKAYTIENSGFGERNLKV